MGKITIVGVGWTSGQLTMDAARALTSGARIVLHTDRCGCSAWLTENSVPFESLDELYDRIEDFDEHALAAAEAVERIAVGENVVYGVFDIRDRSAQLLAERGNSAVRIIPGPPAEGALLAYCRGETRSVEASDWEDFHLTARENCLIRELDSRELAAEVKLKLMEVYPEECAIWLMNGECAPISIPLYELDRAERFDHRTCALIPAQLDIEGLERYDFQHLNEIMRRLCAPDGCPWDRTQTHESLRTCMLEEAYEVMDAIDEGDTDHLYDELGDVLMLVVIHAELARLHGEFDISDVTTAICQKMISRHTHIFGKDRAASSEQVLGLWSRNKMAERGQKTYTEVLRSMTRTLPAMLRAVKVLKRSGEAGLADQDISTIAARCARRVEALPKAGNPESALGEALMDVAGMARLLGVDPEIALSGTINRFIDRFEAVERKIGSDFQSITEETLREYWDLVKL